MKAKLGTDDGKSYTDDNMIFIVFQKSLVFFDSTDITFSRGWSKYSIWSLTLSLDNFVAWRHDHCLFAFHRAGVKQQAALMVMALTTHERAQTPRGNNVRDFQISHRESNLRSKVAFTARLLTLDLERTARGLRSSVDSTFFFAGPDHLFHVPESVRAISFWDGDT